MSTNHISLNTRSIDWVTLAVYISLVCVGWLMIYAVGYKEGIMDDMGAFLKTNPGKQLIFIGISALLFMVVMALDSKIWRTLAYLIYAVSMVLLLLVLVIGSTINGAKAWFSIGGFLFQPSELAKFGTCLALSSYLSSYSTNLRNLPSQLYAIGLLALPMSLILLQPDAGSSLVFLSFFFMLYREGFPPLPFLLGGFFGVLFILALITGGTYVTILLLLLGMFILMFNAKRGRNYWLAGVALLAGINLYLLTNGALPFSWQVSPVQVLLADLTLGAVFAGIHWFQGQARNILLLTMGITLGSLFSYSASYVFNNILEPHQRDRINVWLQPQKCDPRGSLYNLLQAKMAIGSGGFDGKGLLQGTMTKLKYVPEQTTDFIFCTVGEEQGFIGSFGIIGLFLMLLIRITIIAERQRSDFARYYAYGVAGIIFVHFFINIGMTMGLVPVIGIPLPFISYGGSSLLGFSLLMAILLKLDSYRHA